MKEKKVSNKVDKSRLLFTILFSALSVIISVFFIYEYTIGNPFSDPVTPNILWTCLFLITVLFAFRYIKTR